MPSSNVLRQCIECKKKEGTTTPPAFVESSKRVIVEPSPEVLEKMVLRYSASVS